MVIVSAAQRAVLDMLHRQTSCPQALALRIRIILGAADGQRNEPLARSLGCSRPTVRKWRERWAAADAHLACAERDPSNLRQTITTVLGDALRPGAPSTFTSEQIVQIVNLACIAPRAVGRPVDAWTPRELADEAEQQGIVTHISPTTVGRFLGRRPFATASQPLLAERQNQGR